VRGEEELILEWMNDVLVDDGSGWDVVVLAIAGNRKKLENSSRNLRELT
jgi:hypothetical protein